MIAREFTADSIEQQVKAYHVDYWNDTPVSKHFRQTTEELGELGEALIELENYVAHNDFAEDAVIAKLKKKVAIECADVAITMMAILLETDKLHPKANTSLYEEVWDKLWIINQRPKGNHKAEAYKALKEIADAVTGNEDSTKEQILAGIDKLKDKAWMYEDLSK